MLACICCGTLEIAACVAVTTVAPVVWAVVSDLRRRPLDTGKDCINNEDKSETVDVPA
jgi:hypothetical protein